MLETQITTLISLQTENNALLGRILKALPPVGPPTAEALQESLPLATPEAPTPAPPPPAPARVVTEEDIRDAYLAAVQQHGQDAATAAVKRVAGNVLGLAHVAPAHYADAVTALRNLARTEAA